MTDVNNTPYQVHKEYIKSYIKNRYNTDETFRAKVIEQNRRYKKKRLETDDDYRQKCLEQGRERNRRYRIRQIQKKLEEVKQLIENSETIEDKIKNVLLLGKYQKYLDEKE